MMRSISTEGFARPGSLSAGAAPMLQWINIVDLVVDPTYQRPIVGKGRRTVDRIARAFSWSCFSPVVVSPVEGGKFAIIDGQHRTTAAALVGLDSVPCQVVVVPREAQAAAFKAINGVTTPISRMALHAAALVASEPLAVRLAEACACADVQILKYPVPIGLQSPGQTMAVGAIARCLKRYGRETLITAMQCVTQTLNNVPGNLSARTIKALCDVLDGNRQWRDIGTPLFEAFDAIDLAKIEDESALEAVANKVGRVAAMAERIRTELTRLLPPKAAGEKPRADDQTLAKQRTVFDFPPASAASSAGCCSRGR